MRLHEILGANPTYFSFDYKSAESIETALIDLMDSYRNQVEMITELKSKNKELYDKNIKDRMENEEL